MMSRLSHRWRGQPSAVMETSASPLCYASLRPPRASLEVHPSARRRLQNVLLERVLQGILVRIQGREDQRVLTSWAVFRRKTVLAGSCKHSVKCSRCLSCTWPVSEAIRQSRRNRRFQETSEKPPGERLTSSFFFVSF